MQINLSMRDIDTTLVLGRTLNFRQAAAQLHLSQSALSTRCSASRTRWACACSTAPRAP